MVPTAAPGAPAGTSARPVSIRVIAAALAVSAAATAAAPATYLTARHERNAALDVVLLARAQQAAATLGTDATRTVQFAAAFGDDVQGAVVYSDGVIFKPQRSDTIEAYGAPEIAVATRTASQSIRTTTSKDGLKFRTVAVPVGSPSVTSDTITAALVLSQSTHAIQNDLRNMRNLTGLVMLAGIAMCAIATRTMIARLSTVKPPT